MSSPSRSERPPVVPPEEWATERLRLRRPRLDDADALFDAYTHDPEITRYMIWEPHPDVGRTKAFLERCERCWEGGFSFPWVIELDGDPVGMVEIGTKVPPSLAAMSWRERRGDRD
jgi:ribosomal-protein-alanine N-acetyltransferase